MFLDIETVPMEPEWAGLEQAWQVLWEEKSMFYREKNGVALEESYERAGIYAEFGKIICIGLGYFQRTTEGDELRVSSFSGKNERELLTDFGAFLDRYTKRPFRLLCAHNGKEFDFPYLCRRMLINQLPLPTLLRISGKKPWEIPHIDTMELWKFGDYKHYTSLKLLAKVFGVPDSKDDIDGSQVGRVFWKDGDLARIDQYCRKDVVTLARVFQRLNGLDAVDQDNVVHA